MAASRKKNKKRLSKMNLNYKKDEKKRLMKNELKIYIFVLLTMFCLADMSAQVNMADPFQIIRVPQTPMPINFGGNNNPNPALQAEIEFQRELQQTLNSANREAMRKNSIRYDLPTQTSKQGTESYRKTAQILNNMLNGTIPANLKDAVFAVENAYFGGQLEYDKYNNAIQDFITTAKLKTQQQRYNWNNPLTRNVMLFRAMSDTMKIKLPNMETSVMSSPVKYDFEDFKGEKDWTKMFVSKLLSTKSGQCHSLPLLYLILCEATDTEASLAFSPSHTYAKFKDQQGNWYNVELTRGRITSDAVIMASGYITAEALKNKLYMQPQTKIQAINHCLADLAMGYVEKFGYDPFVNQCVDTMLKHDPNSFEAIQIKSNYQTKRFEYVVSQVGRPHPDSLKVHYPHIYELYEERNNAYKRIDESGYREIPKEAYQAWLNSVNKEKKKQEEEKLRRIIRINR